MALNFLNSGIFSGAVGIGTTGIYSTDRDLNLSGKGISIKNNITGSNNNWSYIHNTATASNSNLVFATGAALTALTLEHSGNAIFPGNVGIGTTSPTGDLSVGSTTASSGDIHLRTTKTAVTLTPSNTAAGGFDIDTGFVSGGQGPMTISIGGGEKMRITAGGNLQMKNDTFLSWYTGAGSEVENIGIQASDANGIMKFYTEAVERMSITSTGNVLINHTAGVSETKLYVEGSAMPATGDAASVEDMLTLYRYGSNTVWAGGASLAVGRYATGGSAPKSRLDFKLKDAAGSNVAAPEATVMTMQSNGDVGIGTTTPIGKLTVQGDDADIFLRSNDYTIARIISRGSTGANLDTGLFSLFAPVNTENVRIDAGGNSWFNGGNVGIGVSGPTRKFQIDQSSTTAGGAYVYSNAIHTGTTTNSLVSIRQDNASATGTVLDVRGDGSGDKLIVWEGTDVSLIVKDGGNVGIGTDSPGDKLSIEDSGSVRMSIYSTDTGSQSVPKTFIDLYGENTGAAKRKQASIASAPGHNASNAGELQFFTNDSSQVSQQRMTIREDGTVGIGTATPLEKLVISDSDESLKDVLGVYNSVTTTSALNKGAAIRIGLDAGGSYSTKIATIYEDENPSFLQPALAFFTMNNTYLKGSEVERMRISSAGAIKFNAYGAGTLVTDASGNITASSGGGAGGPYLPLTAGSTKPLTGDLYYNGEIRSTTPAGKLILTNNSTTTELHSAGVDGIKFKGDSDDVKMVILDGGNVGIGATNPLYKLQVQDRIHIEDTATLQPKISFSENTNSNGEFVLEYNGVGGGAVNYVSFYSEVTGWVSKGNGLNYIPQNGYVGIGTTAPGEKLEVEGTVYATPIAYSANQDAYALKIGAIGNVAFDMGVKIKSTSGGVPYMSFRSASTEDVIVVRGSNAGIGTTNPAEKLEVAGSVRIGNMKFQPVNAGRIGFNRNTNTGAIYDSNYPAHQINGATSTDDFFEIQSYSTAGGYQGSVVINAGNVGIGTTSPLSKLHVAGGTSTQTTLTIGANGTNSDKSSKLFFNEGENGVTDSKKFGFSVAYDGQGSQYPGLAANEFGIIRHNNSVNGDVVMKIARTSNNATFIGNVIGNGNIGLGTTNPVSQLNSTKVIKLQSTGNGEVILDHTDAGTASDLGLYSWERNNDHLAHIKASCEGSTTAAFISFHAQPSGGSFANPAANEKMRISSSGNVTIQGTTTATNFILSSDERLKENIEEVCDNRIKADWKTFELKTERGQKRYGVIAQELEKTNPEFVREDTQGFKSVAYIDLLIAKIAELEARLEKLEK